MSQPTRWCHVSLAVGLKRDVSTMNDNQNRSKVEVAMALYKASQTKHLPQLAISDAHNAAKSCNGRDYIHASTNLGMI